MKKKLENQMRFDMGEISQEDYEAREEAIMTQLDLINYLNMENPYEEDEDEDEEYEEEVEEEYAPPQIILLQEPVAIEGIEVRPIEPARQETKDGRVPAHN